MGQPDALVLTAIGIGTAFGVLLMLLVIVLLIRLISWGIDKYTGDDDSPEEAMESTDPRIESGAGSENRNRARAAAIAVTALIESQPHLGRRPREPGQ